MLNDGTTLSPHVHGFFSFNFKEDGYVKKLKFESKICLGDFFTISFIQLKPSLDWTKNSFYRVKRKGKLLDDELVLIMLMGKITYKEIQKHRNSRDADKAYGY